MSLPIRKIGLSCLLSASQTLGIRSVLVICITNTFFLVYEFSALFQLSPLMNEHHRAYQCFIVVSFILKYISFYFDVMKILVYFPQKFYFSHLGL